MLAATACGSGDDSADTPTTAASAAADDDATTTSGTATTTTTPEPVSGDSDSEYCERVRSEEDSPLDISFFGLTPEELQVQFERNLEIFAEWPAIAPEEIKDDAEVVFDFYEQFVERGNEMGWSLEAMADDEAFNALFDSPELDAATTNLDNYTRDVCGVDFTEQSPTPPTAGSDDPLGELLLELGIPIPTSLLSEENLGCLTTELQPLLEAGIDEGYVPTAEDLELLSDAIDTCGIG
jgi:hypothetical protein